MSKDNQNINRIGINVIVYWFTGMFIVDKMKNECIFGVGLIMF